MTPRRILFLNENLGGHATLHLHLREALARTPDVHAEFVDVPEAGSVARLAGAQVPGLARLDGDFAPLRSQLARSLVARRLYRARRADLDALHVYSQTVALLMPGDLRRVPSVVSTDATARQNARQIPYRDPGPLTELTSRPSLALERRVFDAATMVVAQSNWAADAITSECDVEPERLRVIRFGIVPFEVERRAPPALPEVTFVGSTLARKGGSALLRVYRDQLRGRCVLNLVTREPLAAEPGVHVYPDLWPGDGRLHEILARTTVFALPSELDKSPYSVLEAMMAGVPVVSTRVGGIPEMVEDGTTGILVNHDDEALGAALGRLLDDGGLATRMGAAGRERALDLFDAYQTTTELLAVIGEAQRRFRHEPRAARRSFRRGRAARPR